MDRKLPERLRDYAVRLDVLTPSELALHSDLLAAADLLEADGWSPIETAPKDSECGILVGGFHGGPDVFVAYWVDQRTFESYSPYDHPDYSWMAFVPYLGFARISPTHWRPLPTPPGVDHD